MCQILDLDLPFMAWFIFFLDCIPLTSITNCIELAEFATSAYSVLALIRGVPGGNI